MRPGLGTRYRMRWIKVDYNAFNHTSFIIESSRRYNDFKWLHKVLNVEYLCRFVQPMPPASNASNVLPKFGEERGSQTRYDLERFVNRVFIDELLTKSHSFEVLLTQIFKDQQKSIKICTK